MPWEREQVPVGGDLQQLKAYLERMFQNLDAWTARVDERLALVERIAALNGVIILQSWEDTTDTTTAPPVGFLKGNATQLRNVTQFAVSGEDAYGRSIIGGNVLEAGDLITIAASDLSAAAVFAMTSDSVTQNAGSWLQLDVALAGESPGGYNPTQGEFIRASWRPDIIEL